MGGRRLLVGRGKRGEKNVEIVVIDILVEGERGSDGLNWSEGER